MLASIAGLARVVRGGERARGRGRRGSRERAAAVWTLAEGGSTVARAGVGGWIDACEGLRVDWCACECLTRRGDGDAMRSS